jgi:hypothetical protein
MFPSRCAALGESAMRTRRCILLLVFLLAGGFVQADIVKLKDGTELEGDITSEDDATVSIYLEFSGGTITQTRQINKADITEITRWTPEQKAAWQAKRDYENLQKYQLDPNVSYKTGYYDQIINDIFRKYLAQYPSSLYASNVTERITEWQAERAQVAAGKVQYHGQWLPAAEATRLAERDQASQSLLESRSLLSSRKDGEGAVRRLEPIMSMTNEPDLIAEARPLLASAYQLAVETLDQQRHQLEAELSSTQQRVDHASQTLAQKIASLNDARKREQALNTSDGSAQGDGSAQAMDGGAQSFVQAQTAVSSNRSELSSAKDRQTQLHDQLTLVTRKLTLLQSQATAMGIQLQTSTGSSTASPGKAQGQTAVPSPATPTNANSPDVLVSILTWTKNYWMVLPLVVIVAIFLLSRLTKG